MATRFGRRAADGTYEYHDSRESMIAAEGGVLSRNPRFFRETYLPCKYLKPASRGRLRMIADLLSEVGRKPAQCCIQCQSLRL
jgi:hypothetical protein